MRLIVLVLALLVGCGNATQTKIRSELSELNAARAKLTTTIETDDARIQMAIVTAAKTRAEAEAGVAAYRKRRDDLLATFEKAYKLLAEASVGTAPLTDAIKAVLYAIDPHRTAELEATP